MSSLVHQVGSIVGTFWKKHLLSCEPEPEKRKTRSSWEVILPSRVAKREVSRDKRKRIRKSIEVLFELCLKRTY